MTLQHERGDRWYARIGALVVRVEPASVGYRADLGAWTSEYALVRVGLYTSLEEADARAVTDALTFLASQKPCLCRFAEPCAEHARC
jgi:hypothetical protein